MMRGLLRSLKPMGVWGAVSLGVLAVSGGIVPAYLDRFIPSDAAASAVELGWQPFGPWRAQPAILPMPSDDGGGLTLRVILKCSGCVAMVESVQVRLRGEDTQKEVDLTPSGSAWRAELGELPPGPVRELTVSARAYDRNTFQRTWPWPTEASSR